MHNSVTAICVVLLLIVTMLRCADVNVPLGGLITESDPEVSEFGIRNQYAMEIAVEYLNSLGPVVSGSDGELTFVNFTIFVSSSQGNPDLAVNASLALLRERNVVGFVGPYTSRESVAASQSVGTVYKKPFISFGATSGVLANETVHPYFTRVVSQNSAQAEAIIDFVYIMGWNNISVLHGNEPYGSDMAMQMSSFAELKSVRVLGTFAFEHASQIRQALEELKAAGRKIFACAVSNFEDIIVLIRAAKELGMMDKGYIWLFTDSFQAGVYEKQGSVVIDPLLEGISDGIIYVELATSFWFKQDFLLTKWFERTGSFELDQLKPFVFDAVMCYGLALRQMISEGLDIQDGTMLVDKVLSLDFLGASGRLKFASKERIGTTVKIQNLIDKTNTTLLRQIAAWDYENSLEIIKLSDGTAPLVLPGDVEVNIVSSQPTTLTLSSSLQWRPLPKFSNPPAKRHSYCSAISESRDMLLLFGGADILGVFSDFYSFSFKENVWTQIMPLSQSPSGRRDATAFVIGDNFYMFGGFDESVLYNDLWVFSFDSEEWRRIPQVGKWPAPRRTAKSTVVGNMLYLFGGQTKNGAENELWIYNPATNEWQMETYVDATAKPSGIRDHCLTSYSDILVVFGGRTESEIQGLSDLWFYNLTSKVWTKPAQINPPEVRYAQFCAVYRNRLYIGQGWRDSVSTDPYQYNDLYSVDLDSTGTLSWKEILSPEEMTAKGHSGRDSAEALVYQNFIIWHSGWGSLDMLNDFWRFTITSNTLTIVHDNIFSPNGLSGHTAVVIGSNIIAFGGINAKLAPSADLFLFDITKESWLPLVPSGNIPKARYEHSAAVIEDQMYVFGGKNGNEYFGDMWVYSFTLNTWRQIDYHGAQPSPRASHTVQALADGSAIVLFGGSNGASVFTDLWSFSIAEESWTKVTYTSKEKDGFVPFPMGIESALFEEYILFASGSDEVQTPDRTVYLFDTKQNVFTTHAVLDFRNSRNSATVTSISNQYIFLSGGNIYSELTNNVVKVDHNTSSVMDLSSSFNSPRARDQHTAVFFGSKYIIVGGTKAVSGTQFRNNDAIANDVWMLVIGPVCRGNSPSDKCTKCSKGSYEYRSQCLSCPEGYYSDQIGVSECKPCPKGFFGKLSGATSLNFCYPCATGTYNDKEGQNECKECPQGEYCPLGSIVPLQDGIIANTTSPPYVYRPKSNIIEFQTRISTPLTYFATGMVSAVLLLIWLFTRKCLKRVYTYMDVLFDSNHNIHTGPMVRKRTSFGGIASFIAFLFCIALIVNLSVPYFKANLQETRSLIPNLSIRDREVSGDIHAKVTLLDYAASCDIGANKCPPGIIAFTEGSSQSSENLKCIESVNASLPIYSRNCTIELVCNDCRFADTEDLYLKIKVRESNTYAKGFYWSIHSQSGYPLENSTVSSFVRSEEGTLFRGILRPTTVSISGIQTVYRPVAGKGDTGFHLDYLGVSLGETSQWQSFSHKNGVDFYFHIKRSASSLEVIITNKTSLTEFIISVLGGLSGLIGFMGKAVQGLEKTNFRVRKYGKKLMLLLGISKHDVEAVPDKKKRKKKMKNMDEKMESLLLDDEVNDDETLGNETELVLRDSPEITSEYKFMRNHQP